MKIFHRILYSDQEIYNFKVKIIVGDSDIVSRIGDYQVGETVILASDGFFDEM